MDKRDESENKQKREEDNTESEINESTEENADHRNVNNATIWETPEMLPEKNREGKHININEENDCDKKDENVPVEVMLAKNITLKELSKISDNTENAKDKM